MITTPPLKEIAVEVNRMLAAKGAVMAVGFKLMMEIFKDELVDISPEYRRLLACAFYFGGQHVFGSIMSIFDRTGPEDIREPTEEEMRCMNGLATELEEFAQMLKSKSHAK